MNRFVLALAFVLGMLLRIGLLTFRILAVLALCILILLLAPFLLGR